MRCHETAVGPLLVNPPFSLAMIWGPCVFTIPLSLQGTGKWAKSCWGKREFSWPLLSDRSVSGTMGVTKHQRSRARESWCAEDLAADGGEIGIDGESFENPPSSSHTC